MTDLAGEVDRGRFAGLGPLMCLLSRPGDALGDRVDSLMNVRLALASSSSAAISAWVSAISCLNRRISSSWRSLFFPPLKLLAVQPAFVAVGCWHVPWHCQYLLLSAVVGNGSLFLTVQVNPPCCYSDMSHVSPRGLVTLGTASGGFT